MRLPRLTPKRIFLLCFSVLLLYVIAFPTAIIQYGKNRVYTAVADVPATTVGIVFGAGIRRDGTPSDMLEDRLITAAELYRAGKVRVLLVSGDNRFEYYNEPEVMADFLVEKLFVPDEAIVRDYAGRRTYDTCKRASEIFDVQEALLITQGYHLARAIWTCNTVGVTSSGFSATRKQYLQARVFKLRELLAIHKSLFDLAIWNPEYIGGKKERIDSSAVLP